MVIKRIGPLSVAKIAGTLYALFGLFLGAIVSLVAMAGAAFGSGDGGGSWLGPLFGVGAVILLPVFYGGLGFISTLIGAALYNVVAGRVGGIEIEAQ